MTDNCDKCDKCGAEVKQTGGDGYAMNMEQHIAGQPAVEGYNCCDNAAVNPQVAADATNQVGAGDIGTTYKKLDEKCEKYKRTDGDNCETGLVCVGEGTKGSFIQSGTDLIGICKKASVGGGINPFNFIINPTTGARMSLFSSGGKALLKNLINLYKTGGSKTGGEPAPVAEAYNGLEGYFSADMNTRDFNGAQPEWTPKTV